MTQSPYAPQDPARIPSSPEPAPWTAQPGGAPAARSEAGFFRAMFDFSFDHFITVKFSSFIYVLAFVAAGLFWGFQILCGILFGLLLGYDSWSGAAGFNPVPLLLGLFLGWIPSVVLLVLMRLGLEFSVATIRTAQNTQRIAEAAETRV